MKIKNYKYYKILNIEKLGKTGDYEQFLWKIQNTRTDAQFSYITTTSGTRIATERIRTNDDITDDAWPLVKFNLDKGIEKDEHKIGLYSDSELGKYFTPPPVVDFIFDILNVLKNREDKETHRWQSHKPRSHHPSVIDPACGEGIFLKKAVESGFTGEDPRFKAPYVWGIDIDDSVVARWENISILKMFHDDKEKMKNHFYYQDGLMPLKHKVLAYKKGVDDLQRFDAVVGNPPYGGLGASLTFKDKKPEEKFEVLDYFRNFEIFTYKKRKTPKTPNSQSPLWGNAQWGTMPWGGPPAKVSVKEIESTPIEILFVDRFLQLCKPGGWVAIIIPDGILANSTYDYVRRFIAERAKVLGIVSLPRETFKQAGTSAKTSIMFLQKTKDKLLTGQNDLGYPVFLASINQIDRKYFDIMVKEFESFVEAGKLIMDGKTKNPKIIKYTDGNEAIMVRGDKLIEEMMGEKPSGRWDVNYWHPKHSTLEKESKFEIKQLGDFVESITYGAILTEDQRAFTNAGVFYISSTTVTFTGINFFLNPLFVSQKDPRNKESKKPQRGDLIFNRSGVGTLGRQCVFLYDPEQWTISDDTDVIRLKGINPFYTSVYLKSKYGQLEIEQKSRGVSGLIKINFDDIRAIRVPVVAMEIQTQVEREYLKMSEFHDKAMEARKRGNEKAYKENLETAEKMLKDLIAKTEAVVRGERKDVI